eukprot:m51a1_g8935 hypothetical protein (1530) ;mRNA; r:905566-914603
MRVCVVRAVLALALSAASSASSSSPTTSWSTWATPVVLSAAQQQGGGHAGAGATASWLWLLRDSDTLAASDPVGVGDLNGDAFGDLAFNVTRGPSGAVRYGVVVLLVGAAGLPESLDILDPRVRSVLVEGVALRCSCDVTGDGLADLVLQAPGRLVLLEGHRGEWPALVGLRSLQTMWNGEAGTVRALGDISADGCDDIALLLPGNLIAVMLGSANHTFPMDSPFDGTNGFLVPVLGDMFDAAGLGDVDGDRVDDFGAGGFDLDRDNKSDMLLWLSCLAGGRSDCTDDRLWWETVLFGGYEVTDFNTPFRQRPFFCRRGTVMSRLPLGDVDGDRVPDLLDRQDVAGNCQLVVSKGLFRRPADLAIGDINRDGIKDVFVQGHIVLTGNHDNITADQVSVVSQWMATTSGFSATGVGDVSNDGVPDFAFAVANSTTGCWSVIVATKAKWLNVDRSLTAPELSALGLAVVPTLYKVSETTLSISALGDFNGDKINDVLVGVLGASADNVRAIVLLGPSLLRVPFIASYTSNSVNALGDVDGDRLTDFGLETHALGDINGDLVDDFGVGLPLETNSQGYVLAGKIVVVLGNRSAGAWTNWGSGTIQLDRDISYANGTGFVIEGAILFDHLGTLFGDAGDTNGDGVGDMFIGMPDTLDAAGQVTVLLGRNDTVNCMAMIVYRRRIIKEVTRWEPRVWHFDESLRPETIGGGKSYALIDAGRKDSEFVVELYQRCPVPGFELARVQIIYSPHQEQAFENRVAQLQARVGNPAFAPGYEGEGNRATRAAVRERLMEMARRTPEAAYPNVKVVAMWHGTRAEALESVFRAGFASLATTDEGFFGKGVYSAYEARYASEVYSRGALLVNWVSLFSAFPVVDGDMPRLTGKGSYANYDAHFIPVRPASAEAGEQNYVACSELSQAVFHELVTFEASQNLPRYLVTLQPSIVQTVPALTSSRGELISREAGHKAQQQETCAVVSAVPDDQAQPEATASWMLLLRDSDSGDAGGPVGVGDVNGDKLGDVVFGFTRGPSGAAGSDTMYLFDREEGAVLVQGASYVACGDFNGDGLADVVLQASGRLVLLAGHAGEWPASVARESLPTMWSGAASNVRTVGDVNGDKSDDIGFLASGMVNVVFGSANSSGFPADLDKTALSISALEDHNGDKVNDVLVGVLGQTGDGVRAMVLLGPDLSAVSFVTSLIGDTSSSVSALGDVDGDGLSDFGLETHASAGRRRIIKEVTRWEPRVWHFDESLKPDTIGSGKSYALIDAGRRDSEFVVELYQRSPVPGFELARVQIIYSPHQEQAFENRVAQLQARVGNPAFAPGYEGEGNRATRAAVRERLMEMARRTPEAAYPNVKVVAMWHGTRAEALESVFRAGFASLATTDEGFFGKGVYSAYEARYASEVYSRGALLVNWVSLFSAFPVVDGDMPRLTGKGSYANYDAHFIPVRPASAAPGEQNYVACTELSQAVFHELVTFEASQNLPRYLVTLQPSIVQTVPALTSSRGELISREAAHKTQHQEMCVPLPTMGPSVKP